MPSARPSNFKGGGGILRDQDGTIVGIEFTDVNPLYTGEAPAGKTSSFKTLWGVLDIKVDGAEKATRQPIFVGDAEAFGVTDDKMGITGDGEISKSSGWFIFLDSIVNPKNGGAGFDETSFPEDDPQTADYSALVGARCRFNWQVNEKATKKYGKKVSKVVDAKTGKKKEFDREDLIVTNYYGQVDVDAAPAVASVKKVGVSGKMPAAPDVKQPGKKAGKVDIAQVAADNVRLALNQAKGKTLSRSKVSVKLLNLLATDTAETRGAARAWLEDVANVQSIEGVVFDPATEMLSIDESDE
jgi:hypothetical protein